MNPYVYNPAYAGVEGHPVLFLIYKKQWIGISDAPTTMNVNFHIPLKGGVSIGGMAYNETAGLYSQSGGKLSASYLISIDREHFLRFGLSLGAGNNTLNRDELDSPSDPAFTGLVDNDVFFIGDFGFTYHFRRFNIGAALPSLFSYDLFSERSPLPVRVAPQDNALFKMNYRWNIADNFTVEPHILYRYSKYLNDQYETTLLFHLMHLVWIGGTYRQHVGFVGLLGVKLYGKVGIGYAYEYGDPNTASLGGPSHEIHIGCHIGTRKEDVKHVSSFIKGHRGSAEERAGEAELERQKKLQALRAGRQGEELPVVQQGRLIERSAGQWSYEQENEPVERVNKFGKTERGIKFIRLNENGEREVVFSWLPPPPPGIKEERYEIAAPDEEPMIRIRPDGTKEAGIKWIRTLDTGQRETLIIWDEIMSEEEAAQIDHNVSTTMSARDAVIIIKGTPTRDQETENITELPSRTTEPEIYDVLREEINRGDPELTSDFRTNEQLARSDRYLEVKRGTHMLELPAGNYIVAGAFENFYNAESFSDTLFEDGYKEAKVGYLSARGYYYVVMFQSNDLSKTIRKKDRIRNDSGLSNVWVLKVIE